MEAGLGNPQIPSQKPRNSFSWRGLGSRGLEQEAGGLHSATSLMCGQLSSCLGLTYGLGVSSVGLSPSTTLITMWPGANHFGFLVCSHICHNMKWRFRLDGFKTSDWKFCCFEHSNLSLFSVVIVSVVFPGCLLLVVLSLWSLQLPYWHEFYRSHCVLGAKAPTPGPGSDVFLWAVPLKEGLLALRKYRGGWDNIKLPLGFSFTTWTKVPLWSWH